MNDATPREVAWHFGIAAALSLSTVAAPFVPEAIMLYAGYRYLRHFTYGLRTWRAPARIPQHLGAQGYRDETTRRPGDATWPLGLAETGQVWLRREDLVQGVSLHSDDRKWRAEAIGTLVFGACYNRMGAIVVQDAGDEMLTKKLVEVATLFYRDLEVRAFDLKQVPKTPLRISTTTITSVIADLGIGPEAVALHNELLPIIEMLAARFAENLLTIYVSFLDEEGFKNLLKGEIEIDGQDISSKNQSSSDGATLGRAIKSLKKLPEKNLEIGREALIGLVRELAGLRCVSLTTGFDLTAAVSAGSLVCIRPYSNLTAALMVARCNEALANAAPERAKNALIHVAYSEELSGISAQRFRATATRVGAIGTLSFPARTAGHIYKATRKTCALRIESRVSEGIEQSRSGSITSSLKDCPFVLDIQFPAAEKENQDSV